MPYNLAAGSVHTKKLCSRLSLRKAHFLYGKWEKSLLGTLWGLGATYDVHLRLIGKLVGDFLLVIIELFSLGAFVLSLCMRLTDRQTDSQNLDSNTVRMLRSRTVKTDRDHIHINFHLTKLLVMHGILHRTAFLRNFNVADAQLIHVLIPLSCCDIKVHKA